MRLEVFLKFTLSHLDCAFRSAHLLTESIERHELSGTIHKRFTHEVQMPRKRERYRAPTGGNIDRKSFLRRHSFFFLIINRVMGQRVYSVNQRVIASGAMHGVQLHFAHGVDRDDAVVDDTRLRRFPAVHDNPPGGIEV